MLEERNILVVKPFGLSPGGITSYLLGRLPVLARNPLLSITLFMPEDIKTLEYSALLSSAGIKLIEGHIPRGNTFESQLKLRRELDKTMSGDNYDVIHINSSSWVLELHALSIAKRHGIPLRIAHSHSSSFEQGLAKRIAEATFRPLVGYLATDYYACSKSAGEYLFGEELWEKKGVLAPNGLDLERYSFSASNRVMVRNELGAASGSTVVGYVGAFKKQKNPLFLANLAIALCRKDKNLFFWFVGEGPCEPEMRERVSSSGVADRIVFLGTRTDIPSLLHGMDALVLPSLSEGLGFVLIEAEAAGLPCFASEMVPPEAHIPGCPYTVLSLRDDVDQWADTILSSDLSRNENGTTQVASAGYGLGPNVEQLTALYLSPGRHQEVF